MNYLFLLAVIPCILIAYIIYKADKVEKEPIGEIVKAFIMGFAAIFITLFISSFLGIDKIMLDDNIFNTYLYSFFGIALIEELSKFICSYIFVNKNPNFDYMFDGIVYFSCVALGFALVENLLYTANGDLASVLLRAVTAIPAHTFFGISSGYYYVLYRRSKDRGQTNISLLILSILVPILLHGFYDFCILVENDLFLYLFLLFMTFLYCFSISKVKKLQDNDELINKK